MPPPNNPQTSGVSSSNLNAQGPPQKAQPDAQAMWRHVMGGRFVPRDNVGLSNEMLTFVTHQASHHAMTRSEHSPNHQLKYSPAEQLQALRDAQAQKEANAGKELYNNIVQGIGTQNPQKANRGARLHGRGDSTRCGDDDDKCDVKGKNVGEEDDAKKQKQHKIDIPATKENCESFNQILSELDPLTTVTVTKNSNWMWLLKPDPLSRGVPSRPMVSSLAKLLTTRSELMANPKVVDYFTKHQQLESLLEERYVQLEQNPGQKLLFLQQSEQNVVKKKLTQLQTKVDELGALNEEYRQQIDDLMGQVQDLGAQLGNDSVAQLENEIKSLNGQVKDLKSELEHAKDDSLSNLQLAEARATQISGIKSEMDVYKTKYEWLAKATKQ